MKLTLLRVLAVIMALIWDVGIVLLIIPSSDIPWFGLFFTIGAIGGAITANFLADSLNREALAWIKACFLLPPICLPILACLEKDGQGTVFRNLFRP